jgi:hypothetical protein
VKPVATVNPLVTEKALVTRRRAPPLRDGALRWTS